MDISLDLSKKDDLRMLAALVRDVCRAVPDMEFFLTGAYARDVLLLHGHGIETGRQTADVDLAIAVESWERYEAMKAQLIESGHFAAVPANVQKLLYHRALELDFLPFGAIEAADRTIAWPPDGAFVMTMFGYREAYAASITVRLPDETLVQVASLPALALLKLIAWSERRFLQPGKDAHDLRLLLTRYLDAGNQERLYTEAKALVEAHDFDYEAAGAWLLGKHMAQVLGAEDHERIAAMLAQEADEKGAWRLVGDLQVESEKAFKLLAALKSGFTFART